MAKKNVSKTRVGCDASILLLIGALHLNQLDCGKRFMFCRGRDTTTTTAKAQIRRGICKRSALVFARNRREWAFRPINCFALCTFSSAKKNVLYNTYTKVYFLQTKQYWYSSKISQNKIYALQIQCATQGRWHLCLPRPPRLHSSTSWPPSPCQKDLDTPSMSTR